MFLQPLPLTVHIFDYLDGNDLIAVKETCKYWKRIITANLQWKIIEQHLLYTTIKKIQAVIPSHINIQCSEDNLLRQLKRVWSSEEELQARKKPIKGKIIHWMIKKQMSFPLEKFNFLQQEFIIQTQQKNIIQEANLAITYIHLQQSYDLLLQKEKVLQNLYEILGGELKVSQMPFLPEFIGKKVYFYPVLFLREIDLHCMTYPIMKGYYISCFPQLFKKEIFFIIKNKENTKFQFFYEYLPRKKKILHYNDYNKKDFTNEDTKLPYRKNLRWFTRTYDEQHNAIDLPILPSVRTFINHENGEFTTQFIKEMKDFLSSSI